ncbi:MAG: glycosyl transferase family 2, partial [Solirubrobacterales bacterium]|nr:glycosyl transferase family 2 [Solirubrobacterales bacterium]
MAATNIEAAAELSAAVPAPGDRAARLISVVMPVRDGERFLAAALESALGQRDVELELIVVDDGSTDGTARILADALGDPRTTVIHQPGCGVAQARNIALAHAHGEFVAFLDSDDVWLPDKLARQLALFDEDPALAVAFTGYVITGPGLEPKGVVRCTDLRGWLMLDGEAPALASTAMVRRSALGAELYFAESLAAAEDLEFACRAARCGTLATIDLPLALYRRHDGQATGNLEALARDVPILWEMLAADGRATRRQRDLALGNLHVLMMLRALRRGRLGRAARHLRAVA